LILATAVVARGVQTRPRMFRRRFVCVRQADQSDCGPAALATVALQHGVRISRERLRDVVGTDRIGTNLAGLVAGAEKLGLRARAVKGDWDGLRGIAVPAIAHIKNADGLGHYVVVHAVDKRGVVVADPARGIVRQRRDQFVAAWTGYCLLLSPTPDLAASDTASPGQRFISLVFGQRRLLIEAFACAVFMTALGLTTSLFVQHLCDGVLARGETDLLDAFGLGVLAVVVFRAAFGALRLYLMSFAARRSGFDLLSGYMRHVVRLPMRFFELRQSGDVLARVQDATRVRDAIGGVTLSLLVDGAMVVLAAAALWLQDARLALVATLFVPALAISAIAHRPATRRRTRAVMEEAGRVQSQLVEDISGIETIKALGLESTRSDSGEVKLANLFGLAFAQQKLGMSAQTIATLAMGAAGAAVLWYGGHRVVEGEVSIGQLMFFYTLLGYLLQPLERLAQAYLQLEDALVSLDRLYQVMDLELESGHGVGLPFENLDTAIELHDVSFKYGSRAHVVDKLSLAIPTGKRVALIGESGSGKTTVLKLIQRFYDPTDGRITFDGIDLRDLDVDSVRARIGVVSQDPYLFTGTLRDNLMAARPDATPEQLRDAIKVAGLEDVIAALPERLETPVGERGAALSGGQRQRLAIARAVLKRPAILLLDEATSHLDSATEAAVQGALDTVLAGTTMVIVAHRLATVRSADFIYVLHRGAVVEAGTHFELIANCGRYAAMWRSQLGSAVPPARVLHFPEPSAREAS
jgi:ATP-binding cassette, subfamily C, bacteriocin exporter